jgi:hypothetical protein
MPAVMTYTSLVSDLQTYSERTDGNFVTQIPRLIMMAENRIATDAKILGYLTPMTGSLSIGEFTIAKPNFWRETVSMNFTDGSSNTKPILPRTYEYLRNFWPNNSATPQPPRFYADYDFNNWLIAPPCDQAYTFEIMVYVRQQPLDSATTTNWLTANAPQLLFSACMLEAQLWMKNFDRVTFWKNEYAGALSGFNTEDMQRTVDRNILLRQQRAQS